MKMYATTDGGERFLAYIACDHGDCKETIRPQPDIAKSGWTRYGIHMGVGHDHVDLGDYCPDHEMHGRALVQQ